VTGLSYRCLLSLWLGCCGLMAYTAMAGAQPQESIGQVVILQGAATVHHQGRTQSETLAQGSLLYQEDTVQTHAASKVVLTLADGTVLSLGEQTILTISKSVYSPQAQTQTSILTIIHGIFRAIMTKVMPDATFEVHTTTAVAAIRGTDWLGQVTPDATAIVVLEGEVRVTHTRPDIPGAVILTAGMGTDVSDSLPPTPAKQWGQARIDGLIQATMVP
jgi:ferric-dicitrate binding protein FerR (iron transport regulator)